MQLCRRLYDRRETTDLDGLGYRTGLIAAIATLLLCGIALPPTDANAARSCHRSISACGCTIAAPGVYTVTGDLSSLQGHTPLHDCIDVSAPNVRLFLQGFSITGPGSAGTGIRLLSTANGAFIEGTAAGPSGFAVISGWLFGIEDEAANGTLEDFESNSNGEGIVLKRARNNTLSNFSAVSNTIGVRLVGANANKISEGLSESNTWGIQLTCTSNCPNGSPSTNNRIYNFMTSNNFLGILVLRSCSKNIFTDDSSLSTGPEDYIDDNKNCTANLWKLNGFTTADPACIN